MGSVVMVVVGCGVVRAPASIGSVVVVVVDCDTGKVPSSMVVVSCGMIMSPANTGSVVVGCGVVRAPSNMASVVVVVTGEASVEFTTLDNSDYDDRSVSVTIKAGTDFHASYTGCACMSMPAPPP